MCVLRSSLTPLNAPFDLSEIKSCQEDANKRAAELDTTVRVEEHNGVWYAITGNATVETPSEWNDVVSNFLDNSPEAALRFWLVCHSPTEGSVTACL